MISITPNEIELFAEFIHARTGIVLNNTKGYLLESRLGSMLEEYGARNFTEFFYAGYLSSEWVARVVDAISTHETSFFRDQRPFELLQTKILSDFISQRQNRLESSSSGLQIWSAACSTGQEAYSVGMNIAELLGSELSRWNITITGTDISDFAINKARQGLYTNYEVERGVPLNLRQKYFESQGELLKVRADLQAMTVFKKMNLLAAAERSDFYDIILCRNVAIYFNQENRRRLFEKIAACLRPEGILIIGSTESLYGVSDRFIRNESCNTVYFQAKRNQND
ncbi:MAG: protein-glutamate O-methyltransferase CheR [Desulfurivibrionaceae bacterium]|jgi:chemotaxis protein methyltransferase CheR